MKACELRVCVGFVQNGGNFDNGGKRIFYCPCSSKIGNWTRHHLDSEFRHTSKNFEEGLLIDILEKITFS
jgi:hypothetical protein